MVKIDYLLETVMRVGVKEFENMSKSDDPKKSFCLMKLNDGQIVMMQINTPERIEFYKKTVKLQNQKGDDA